MFQPSQLTKELVQVTLDLINEQVEDESKRVPDADEFLKNETVAVFTEVLIQVTLRALAEKIEKVVEEVEDDGA
jgi:hypothetical protein